MKALRTVLALALVAAVSMMAGGAKSKRITEAGTPTFMPARRVAAPTMPKRTAVAPVVATRCLLL